jgi:restriction system protein
MGLKGDANLSPSLSAWSVPLLQCLDWRRFEELCAEALSLAGYDARFTSDGADGGVDLILRSPGSDEEDVAVQCKRWKNSIKLSAVWEFYGASQRAGLRKAIFITTSNFTVPVYREYGDDEDFVLVDGSRMIQAMADLGRSASNHLLKFAITGEDWFVPSCVNCGIKMALRRPRSNGKKYEPFWGCPNFARAGCRETLSLPTEGPLQALALGMERAGQGGIEGGG